MFDALLNSVLPVFAMVGIGALCRYFGWFAQSEANALSKFVYFIAGPVLLFRLVSTVDLAQFNVLFIGSYLLAEMIVYVLAYLLFRRVFRRDVRESILLGMTSVFANHVLYLLPIAIYQFGEERAATIVTFIAGDLVVIYGATLMLLDATEPGKGRASVAGVAGRMATNPQLIALALGLCAKALNIPIGGGVAVFAQFLSGAASPASLFALGIVLMSQRAMGDLRISFAAAGLKLIAMPAVAAALLLLVFRQPVESAGLTLLISSAPCGVMTFVLALRYNVPSENIGRAVLIATLLSTVSVSLMLQAI